MNAINTVIVEDEMYAMDNLVQKLDRNCPQVKIVGKCKNLEDAVQTIYNTNPQLVLLDIEIGSRSGFDVLERLKSIPFKTIIITGKSKYAIDAVNKDALYFLLKPIDEEELVKSVQKAERSLVKGEDEGKMVIAVGDGWQIVYFKDILYLEADNNYAHIHFSNGMKKVTISKPLAYLMNKVTNPPIMRIHRKYAVHIKKVIRLIHADGGYLLLNDGKTKLPVNKESKEWWRNYLRPD